MPNGAISASERAASPASTERPRLGRPLRLLLAAGEMLPTAAFVLWAVPALRRPMWRDEWATWQFSGLGVHDLWRATSHVDRALMWYYLLCHGLRQIWDDPAILRLLSLAGGVAAVVTVQLVVRRIWTPVAGVLATLPMVCAPSLLVLSTEARPFGVALGAVGVTTWLVVRPGRRALCAYAVLLGLSILVDPLVILVLPAQIVWVYRQRGGRAARWWVVGASPALATALGWSLACLGQRAQLVQSSVAGAVIAQAKTVLGGTWQLLALHIVAAAVALLLLGDDSPSETWRASRSGLITALLLGDGTVALMWLATELGIPMIAWEYMVALPLGGAMVVGGAVGHARHLFGNGRRGLAVLAPALLAVGGLSVWTITPYVTHRQSTSAVDGSDTAAHWLLRHVRPGDALVIQQPYAAGGFAAGIAGELHDAGTQEALRRAVVAGRTEDIPRLITEVGRDDLRTRSVPGGHRTRHIWVVSLSIDTLRGSSFQALGCKSVVAGTGVTIAAALSSRIEIQVFTCDATSDGSSPRT